MFFRRDTNFRTKQQGYSPDLQGQSDQPQTGRTRISLARRSSRTAKNRRHRAVILSGIFLSILGVWLISQAVIVKINREHEEAQLAEIYYGAFLTEVPRLRTAAPELTKTPNKVKTAAELLPRTFVTPNPYVPFYTKDRFLPLRKINKDVVGWLNIKNVLDLPVVYRDNAYYLTHDFQGNKSSSGTLFLDENFSIRPPNENLVIHGHNMRDGSMFGRLHRYGDRPFYLKHSIIQFETLYGDGDYVVFAVLNVSMNVSNPLYFQFAYNRFDTDIQFNAYVDLLKKRSIFQNDIDIDPTDALLTLSTCYNVSDNYFVIVARKVREGESPAEVKMLLSSSIVSN